MAIYANERITAAEPQPRSRFTRGVSRMFAWVRGGARCGGDGHSFHDVPYGLAVEEDGVLRCVEHCGPDNAIRMREWLAQRVVEEQRRRAPGATGGVAAPAFGSGSQRPLGSGRKAARDRSLTVSDELWGRGY